MRKLIESTLVSLDGVIESPERWAMFDDEASQLSMRELDNYDAFVMGRVTYEAMWEISSSASDEVSTGMNELPKVVFSNTLTEPLAWNNTRLIRGDLGEQMRALKRQSSDPLRSIGSITLVRSLIHLGLVSSQRAAAGKDAPIRKVGGNRQMPQINARKTIAGIPCPTAAV